jgi:hypothetical protein
MKTYLLPLLGLSLLTAGVTPTSPAHAQKAGGKKPPVNKTVAAAKPAPAKSGPIVLGTTQMAGDFGQFGTTYTIGKNNPINFTLKSAEYTTARFNADTSSVVPDKDQKLLVLHYTIHNPQPREQRYYWADMKFTAVDSQDTNHEFAQAVTREGTSQSVEISLKPAQKLEVQTAIVVPANGVVPKLIVQREEGAPVIRYDLRGKVKPLPAPIADPADTSGATVRKAAIPAEAGAYYPFGVFDFQFESAAYTTEALRSDGPGDGNRYLTATFRIKNATGTPQRYYWATFEPELRDSDGEKVEYPQILLKGTRNDDAEGNLAPGEETRIRFVFVLPQKTGGKTLTLSENIVNMSHPYVFDVSGAK